MQKNEFFIRKILSNLAIALAVISVFGAAIISNAITNAQTKPNGAIYKGQSATTVSLMFNVYWGTAYLDSILQTLDAHKVSTTFFIGGSWASENEETLKKISYYGHEIANHAYFHKDHAKLSSAQNREEILVTHKLLEAILGVNANLFSPPSASFNAHTITESTKLGYKVIMYSKDTIDWQTQDQNKIFTRATNKISGGDLVLMHPTDATAKVLDRIIKHIVAQGLKVGTVSEALTP